MFGDMLVETEEVSVASGAGWSANKASGLLFILLIEFWTVTGCITKARTAVWAIAKGAQAQSKAKQRLNSHHVCSMG
jgi:hypothetical protein